MAVHSLTHFFMHLAWSSAMAATGAPRITRAAREPANSERAGTAAFSPGLRSARATVKATERFATAAGCCLPVALALARVLHPRGSVGTLTNDAEVVQANIMNTLDADNKDNQPIHNLKT
eukprot:CAMPEP_0118924144 /NCGR_PEP_ID=MMETSP1169-20130426/2416_1 /TAXON_ID=36882 /ORGANISM="Pyramimonas obovata, Strain CCMP722" /LENGTH=119 /DNA_ID=CAMNT_0006865231 /DNA_START=452 /DNA_END=811 /DNA_ORIENTATION=-